MTQPNNTQDSPTNRLENSLENNTQTPRQRAMCTQCLRAEKSCICDLACHLNNCTEVLILQHPLEQKNAKGTAKLVELSLAQCSLVVGETFCKNELQNLLSNSHHNILLYPPDNTDNINSAYNIKSTDNTNSSEKSDGTDSNPITSDISGQNLDPSAQNKPTRLVILDGTWRKSRKLLHCNPLLASLPRLALTGDINSRYHIRKAHKPGQLSTLEACCLALDELESLDTQPLLSSFERFVERQQRQAQQGRAISGTIHD